MRGAKAAWGGHGWDGPEIVHEAAQTARDELRSQGCDVVGDLSVVRPRVYSRNGVRYLVVRAWRADRYKEGIRALAKAKDGLDPRWLEAMARDVAAAVRDLCVAHPGTIVTAPPARHSHFLGIPHFATLAAQMAAAELGLEHRVCFAPTAAKAKGHSPKIEKDPPKAIEFPSETIVVDDFATSGWTMCESLKALRSKGRAVGFCWIAGDVRG